jgi:ribose transport system substrate-binding protein
LTHSFRSRGRIVWAAVVALLSVALLALSACGSSDDESASDSGGAATTAAGSTTSTGTDASSSAGGSVKRGLKLAYYSVGANNTYLQSGIKGARETAARYGATIDVFDGAFDGGKQLNQVMDGVTSGDYDGIVLEPNNSQQLCAAVKAAIDADIPIGITNVPACDAAYDSAYDGTAIFVGGQSPQVYEQWFSKGFDADPAGGDFAVMNGPATQGNTLRARDVLDQTIEPKYPRWNEAGFDYTDYQASIALSKTQTLLQKTPDVKAIFSSYSGSTPGIISAVKAANKLGQVRIYDLGGDKTMFKALRDDEIASTLVYLPYEEAQRGVQAVVAQASGMDELDGVPVGRFWDLTRDPRLKGMDPFVTKDTIARFNAIGLPEY